MKIPPLLAGVRLARCYEVIEYHAVTLELILSGRDAGGEPSSASRISRSNSVASVTSSSNRSSHQVIRSDADSNHTADASTPASANASGGRGQGLTK